MIIDNGYFKGEIYIPHAIGSITDTIEGIGQDLSMFIEEYVRECLIKSLGSTLAYEFINELDFTTENGLKGTADAKWNLLMNGDSYTEDGVSKVWRGIRFKSNPDKDYDKSFLAYYVYYFYEQDYYLTRSDIGTQKEVGKNAEVVAPTMKVTNAWNKFVKMVQGESLQPTIYQTPLGFGVDYLGSVNQEVTLYEYINYKNDEVADTFAEFTPKSWAFMTRFGI